MSSIAPRYHINPETGNPGKCNAKYSCRFGNIEKDHFDSKEAAREEYEFKAESESKTPEYFEKTILKNIKESRQELPVSEFIMRGIMNPEYPKRRNSKEWRANEKEDAARLIKIQELLKGDRLNKESLNEAQKEMSRLHGTDYNETKYYRSYSDEINNRRDSKISSLAENVIQYSEGKLYEGIKNAPARQRNDVAVGLDDARLKYLENHNLIGYEEKRKRYYLDENISDHLEDNLDRLNAGEVYKLDSAYDGAPTYLAQPENKILALISDPDSREYDNQAYLALAWPDRELRESFMQHKVENVFTSTLDNGRERGLVYTVMQPGGSTRSFAVYEHRNSDSIIINGKENWDGKERPYAGESKEDFFAEFGRNDRKAAADSLSFYIKEAQNGELKSDGHLASTVERRDWVEIINKTIPGYKDWVEKAYPETKKKDGEEDINFPKF